MPYIKKTDRDKIHTVDAQGNAALDYIVIDTPGELQYAIAVILKDFVSRKGLCYSTCNDIMGALAGAQMEFYRKTVAPYEDTKIEENGDV